MVKHFRATDGEYLESMINKWITSATNVRISSINYQLCNEDGEIWHYALVLYYNA